MKNSKTSGITLIELMVAIAIVMIIAVIAFPSYQAQVEKSRRTEARAALANISLAQERAFSVNGAYATDLTTLQLATGLTAVNAALITTEQGFYNITLDAGASGTAYTANATAVGGQAGDTGCAWMAMDHLGQKTATSAACW
jgi:type IV pilus assembly protein PilE